MDWNNSRLLLTLSALSLGIALAVSGCGDDGPGATGCETTSDCPAGQGCLQVNDLGNFDPMLPGVCLSEECRSDAQCNAGEVCRGNMCVLPGQGPGTGGDPTSGGPVFCDTEDDCAAGQRCEGNVCTGGGGNPTTPGPTTTDEGACADVVCGDGERCQDGVCVPEPSEGVAGCENCTAGQVCINDTCYPEGYTECGSTACAPGQTCDNGVCTSGPSNGNLCSGVTCPTGQVCNPATGQCIVNTCELQPSDCPDNRPFVDIVGCVCVGCTSSADCESDEVCTPLNRCLYEGSGPCSSQADCQASGTFCQAGRCVDCISQSDCGAGLFCVRGACKPCTCPEGEICSASGVCIPESTNNCSSNAECQSIAATIGADNAQDAACDPGVGCFIPGACNSGIGGDDPFNAECPAGMQCRAGSDGDLLGNLIGEGGSGSACGACVEGAAPGTAGGCRQGEECRAGGEICFIPGILCFPSPFGESEPTCQAAGGGGGGGLPGF